MARVKGIEYLLVQLSAVHPAIDIARVHPRPVFMPGQSRDLRALVNVFLCLQSLGLELWVAKVVLPHHNNP